MKNILDFSPTCKAKSPTEFCGPCPSCGGDDRFIIWPERGDTGRFMCRGCGASGDGIDFLRNFEGMSYVDACKTLGVPTKDKRTFHKATASQAEATRQKEPQEAMPSDTWATAATAFLTECQAELLRSPEAAEVVHGQRYIGEQAALTCGIGWHNRDEYFTRESFGLPILQGKTKLLIPKGLVISTRRKSGVVALTIRCPDSRPEGRPKYWQVAGSARVPFMIGQTGVPVVIVESALDAVLIHQESEGTISAVGLMGASKDFDADTRAFIEQSSCVIACPDADEAGNKAWSRWRSQFPKARRVLPLNAKDLTDMHALATMQLMCGEQRTAPFVDEWLRIVLEIARD